MIALLAFRNLTHRPWRSAFLFLGYGIGVGVMIVLLSIGEALVTQASDEKLVGGGDVTVLPEGLDIEVMKTGGLGGLFFSIDHARFVHRQLLGAPRQRDVVAAVAPQIDGKLAYLRTADGQERAVRLSGELPSATRTVGGAPRYVAGAWDDDDGDRRWTAPTPLELRHEIDRFHLPSSDTRDRESWAEWHYFNVLSADRTRWAFISLIVGGDVPDGEWGGSVTITLREQNGATRRFESRFPAADVRFSTDSADLTIGRSTVRVLPDGRYAVRALAAEQQGSRVVDVDLVVAPAPGAYFPGAALAEGEFTSGYAVAALRADASGTICVSGSCETYASAQAYHDHNWGVWRGVTWEWGAARAGAYSILYGRVHPPGAEPPPLFVYLVDSAGFRAVFRPTRITYEDGRTIVVDGKSIRVPARAVMADARGADTLRIELEIEDAIGTDMRQGFVERGDPAAAARLSHPYFIQMKGLARLTGTVGRSRIEGRGTGFFETYR